MVILFVLSIVTFTQRRVNTSAKHEIRLLIDKMLNEKIIQLDLDQFIQEVTLGGLK